MNKTIILTSIWVLINSGAAFAGHGYNTDDATDPVKTPKKKTSKKTSVDQTPTRTQGYNENATVGQKATLTTTGQTTATVDTPEGGTGTINKVNASPAKKITNTSKLMKKTLDLGPKTFVTGPDREGLYTVTVGGQTYKTRKVADDRAKRLVDRARLLTSEVSYNEQSAGATAGTEAFEVVGTPPKIRTLLTSDGKPHEPSYYAFITDQAQRDTASVWKKDPKNPKSGGEWNGDGGDISVLLIRDGHLVGGGGGDGGGGQQPGEGAEGEAPPGAPGT